MKSSAIPTLPVDDSDNKRVEGLINRLALNKTNFLVLSYLSLTSAQVKSLAQALTKNISLTKLFCYECEIDDKGAKKIAEMLKVNTSLTELAMGNNKIGDAGAKEILEALKTNFTLITLDLSHNQISAEIIKLIADQITINRKIHETLLNYNQLPITGNPSIHSYVLKLLNKKNPNTKHSIAPPSLLQIALGVVRENFPPKNKLYGHCPQYIRERVDSPSLLGLINTRLQFNLFVSSPIQKNNEKEAVIESKLRMMK